MNCDSLRAIGNMAPKAPGRDPRFSAATTAPRCCGKTSLRKKRRSRKAAQIRRRIKCRSAFRLSKILNRAAFSRPARNFSSVRGLAFAGA